MIFKVYESDFGITLNGVDYIFTDVENMAIDDPEFTRLTRGANAANKEGLVYKEGAKEPKRVTVTIRNLTPSLKGVLDNCYKNKTRIDSVYCIARADGSRKMANKAILCQQPQQLNVDETPEAMNVVLTFESFDLVETHKS